MAGNGGEEGYGLEELLGFARARSETADSRQWVSDLEDLIRVAWSLMTDAQRADFRAHPDVLAIVQAASGA